MNPAEKGKKASIERKLYLSNAFLILLTVLITGIVCLKYTVSVKQRDMDDTILKLSSVVSQMDAVKAGLKSGGLDKTTKEELNLLVKSFDEVDVLVICDTDSIRLYHNNEEQVGQRFVGDDQNGVLMGAQPYISEAVGTLGPQRRAFRAILSDDGAIAGFVMVSTLTASLMQIRVQIIGTFLLLLAGLSLCGFVFSAVSSHWLRNLFLGHRPEEFKNMYIERTEVLDALDEGIFAINTEGNVILMNRAAKKLLDITPEQATEGTSLCSIFPETRLPDTLKTGAAEHNVYFSIHGNHIISSRIPVRQNEEIIGAVSIFRNRTEVIKLAEELTGANYMVDTLRAFNHEFMNKLHIILGLLEVNETEKAKAFITQTSLVSGEAVSDISHRVPIANLAALLIGKMLRASELGITFTLRPDSYFHSKTLSLPADCMTTLVGNLLENAIEELNSRDYPVKEIELGVYSEEGHTLIVCDDTGGGIPEEILRSIYERYTTTKGPGHGTGMALIREIVDRFAGAIHIDTKQGEGTSIEITLPV